MSTQHRRNPEIVSPPNLPATKLGADVLLGARGSALRTRALARTAARGKPSRTSAAEAGTSVTSVNDDRTSQIEVEEEWPDPTPLSPPPPPSLPADGLPPWLRDQIKSVSEATEAPRDMALLLGLTAVSSAVANKGIVVVKTGYTEPLQIWTASVAPPGSRKSPVYSHMLEPIRDYETEEETRYEAKMREIRDELEIVEEALRKAKKDATRALRKGDGYEEAKREVAELRARLSELTPSTPDVVTVSDITPERLGQRMAEHYGRAAIVSPEGDIFSIMSGLYSDGRLNLQVFKKGWTGDEAITDDRIMREGTRVERPALVIGLTVQPSVLANLRGKKQFRGEGLLGRFMFAQPEDRIGYRQTGKDVPPLDPDAADRYGECLRVLIESRPADEDGDQWVPHGLPLSPSAAEARDAFAEEVEHSLRPGEQLDAMQDWGAKIVGNMVRVAGLIHLAWQVEEGAVLWDEPVSGRAMEAAVELGNHLIPHARTVFDRMDAVPTIRLARYVLKRITTYEGEEPLTKRELHRRCQGKSEIQQVVDLEEPLSVLEKHDIIRRCRREPAGGRRPSPIIQLNPKAQDRIDRSDRSRRSVQRALGEAEAAPAAAD